MVAPFLLPWSPRFALGLIVALPAVDVINLRLEVVATQAMC